MKDLPTKKPENQIINVQPGKLAVSSDSVTVWLTYSFAPEWYQDAINEAKTGKDHNARRREIVFAVNFAESYIVEWVRDDVLHRDFQRFRTCFPANVKYSAYNKWKEIPKLLRDNGLIPRVPDLNQSYREEFRKLVDYRDGLVHAAASRPETSSLPVTEKPVPPKSLLDQLEPGWAVKVVLELARQLHKAVGTTPPPWLIDP